MDNNDSRRGDCHSTAGPQFLSFKETRKILGVTADTLRRWDTSGRVQTIRTPGNVRLFNKENVEDILSRHRPSEKKKKVAYCRVCSRQQLEDLELAYFRDKFPHHLLVSDIGSGLNWKRTGLRSILERASKREISEVLVAHRDRLCRFGFELIEFILQDLFGCKLTVLADDSNASSEQDLADDILSIVHVYSCRQMGRRRYKTNKPELASDQSPNISEFRTTKSPPTMDGDRPICVEQSIGSYQSTAQPERNHQNTTTQEISNSSSDESSCEKDPGEHGP